MSVEVCRIALLHPVLPEIETEEEDEQQQMLDIWSSIQKNNENIMVAPPSSLYVHPLVRQSSSLMSQNSLEICTESLGSETGSYEFSGDELMDSPFRDETEDEEEVEEEEEYQEMERNDLSNVKYHCSISRRSPVRSFPPPLPSISRRDGFCFKMQPRRHNGRLVLESVPVPSHNYLRAERHGGRLLLSFIETAGQSNSPAPTELQSEKQNQEEEVLRETEEGDVLMEAEEEEDEEEEEEEVEVVDRGTMVEVKVSTQPPPANRAGMLKVHRSSLVINKFVVGSPLPVQASSHMKGKRTVLSTTTAAVAALTAASNNMSSPNKDNSLQQQGSRWVPLSPAAAASSDSMLLFTSKRRSRDELLHDVRRCSELRRLLFIFEQPYCIATS